jgi:putative FmdB family regulatory protein
MEAVRPILLSESVLIVLYEYRCLSCSEITEAHRRVNERDDCPECDVCGSATKKIISGYRVHGDLAPYFDENLETYISSKQHRQQVMREQGVYEHYGQGWHTSAKKVRR